MNKTQKIVFVTTLVLSPLILGLFYSRSQPSDSAFGLAMFIAIIFGWPFILTTGWGVSYLTIKSKRANLYFILGYLIPTLLVLSWEFGWLQKILA